MPIPALMVVSFHWVVAHISCLSVTFSLCVPPLCVSLTQMPAVADKTHVDSPGYHIVTSTENPFPGSNYPRLIFATMIKCSDKKQIWENVVKLLQATTQHYREVKART